MHRKDYQIIAKALHSTKPKDEDAHLYDLPQWKIDCAAITIALAEDNDNFNISKFQQACEGESS